MAALGESIITTARETVFELELNMNIALGIIENFITSG